MDHMLNHYSKPARQSKRYTIAPLRWEKDPDAEIWRAQNRFGLFVYGRDASGLCYFQTPGPSADRPDLDAAQRAAQAYFESLITPFLEVSP